MCYTHSMLMNIHSSKYMCGNAESSLIQVYASYIFGFVESFQLRV